MNLILRIYPVIGFGLCVFSGRHISQTLLGDEVNTKGKEGGGLGASISVEDGFIIGTKAQATAGDC